MIVQIVDYPEERERGDAFRFVSFLGVADDLVCPSHTVAIGRNSLECRSFVTLFPSAMVSEICFQHHQGKPDGRETFLYGLCIYIYNAATV